MNSRFLPFGSRAREAGGPRACVDAARRRRTLNVNHPHEKNARRIEIIAKTKPPACGGLGGACVGATRRRRTLNPNKENPRHLAETNSKYKPEALTSQGRAELRSAATFKVQLGAT